MNLTHCVSKLLTVLKVKTTCETHPYHVFYPHHMYCHVIKDAALDPLVTSVLTSKKRETREMSIAEFSHLDTPMKYTYIYICVIYVYRYMMSLPYLLFFHDKDTISMRSIKGFIIFKIRLRDSRGGQKAARSGPFIRSQQRICFQVIRPGQWKHGNFSGAKKGKIKD